MTQKNKTTTTTTTTTNTTTTSSEKKKKKNKKKKKKTQLGSDDEHTYNYGNVIDTNKEWNEEILGQYLKDAGFVRGSLDNTPANNKVAEMTPIYVDFTNKVVSKALHISGGSKDAHYKLEQSGNDMIDYGKAFNLIGGYIDIFESLGPYMPPSYTKMTCLLVVAAYVLGLPGYGSFVNNVKHTLVEMNKEIPRGIHDLSIKIRYNRFYGLPDQQKLVWDKSKLTQYLLTNSIRKYSTTKYPPTKDNFNHIIKICKWVMNLITKNLGSVMKQGRALELQRQLDRATVEEALQIVGRMAFPLWKARDKWALDMRLYLLFITLLAFQSGVINYIHTPLIIDSLQPETLNSLEHPFYDFDVDIPSSFMRIHNSLE
ncbi:hypothetical protein DFA_11214 [Cavenderia fasciculata]|uniref:Uncharacterized protein n=1 Tax=Cavenderia fasciculata TaxID=261658 RepID=F4QFK0_CACFS|nr:uncharacterized protein DFA_11214 [Cavenderia fasciculata]EGG13453.1 hypothetical protein DFA_11214 [Cavenderia fasciculata]|eukprot:XP_004350157.1 hypothetical protein DFA_11214 [Cavenderia fasciculata]